MSFELSSLPYEYDSLEPYIDARTMEIHHGKHHAAYVKKLNDALSEFSDLKDKDVNELLEDLNNVPEEVRWAVRNNGGGHANHSLFWEIMKKGVEFKGEVAEKIKEVFGSFEEFKKKFSEAGMTQFGSGWVWLVVSNEELEIIKTGNQDTPLSEGKKPILCLDVWEHAYYLKYQNRRVDYIDAFFNIINWDKVNEFYLG